MVFRYQLDAADFAQQDASNSKELYDYGAAQEIERADELEYEPDYHGASQDIDVDEALLPTPQLTQSTKRASTPRKEPQPQEEVFDIIDSGDEDPVIPVHSDPSKPEGDIRIQEKTREIAFVDTQIADLQAARALLIHERSQLQSAQPKKKLQYAADAKAKASGKVTDYSDSKNFEWSKKLQSSLHEVFGITKLRLCQEAVLNAVLDGRDVICIMPTGGGKSVCFQAPALLTPGCTLVISPLLSLMADQVMHLTEKGVNAVMITGSTGKEEMKDITRRLLLKEGCSKEASIKLCYVTPEKIAKSKTFLSTLSKMFSAGLLARIAIDESHCCSQMGHDFRPDYKKLSTLKQLFPTVPIIALTATCGKVVLNDVVRILRLAACTPGESAEKGKTAFFSSPLYRQNLRYSIRIKPSSAPAVVREMADEILAKHPNETGIIYCLSQKDTTTVAQGLYECSSGKIRTGTYHAGMDDVEKQRIHERWRNGKVRCVVATIAFGMGIDAPDVRYVYHHCISKSMEGYYQETGRAGRDGKDSDCVLWFRPADASRLSTLSVREVEGQEKLYQMLKYATDNTTCRKLLFDSYFGNPASVIAPDAESDRSVCGHCDNCLRASTAHANDSGVRTQDATLDAWKICKVIKSMESQQGKVTLQQACDIVRGLGKGAFQKSDKGSKGNVDLQQECGGKVSLSKDDTELLILQLIIGGFLKEEFFATAYTTISYIRTGTGAARLLYLNEEQLRASPVKVELTTPFTKKQAKISNKILKNGTSDDENASAKRVKKGRGKALPMAKEGEKAIKKRKVQTLEATQTWDKGGERDDNVGGEEEGEQEGYKDNFYFDDDDDETHETKDLDDLPDDDGDKHAGLGQEDVWEQPEWRRLASTSRRVTKTPKHAIATNNITIDLD